MFIDDILSLGLKSENIKCNTVVTVLSFAHLEIFESSKTGPGRL